MVSKQREYWYCRKRSLGKLRGTRAGCRAEGLSAASSVALQERWFYSYRRLEEWKGLRLYLSLSGWELISLSVPSHRAGTYLLCKLLWDLQTGRSTLTWQLWASRSVPLPVVPLPVLDAPLTSPPLWGAAAAWEGESIPHSPCKSIDGNIKCIVLLKLAELVWINAKD